MPPNLTHLLQPLDVVIFQPLKHYRAKAIDIMVRDGLTNITKIELLGCIQEVRKKAFKVDTIRSAFKKTSIWSYNPHVVLAKIDERLAKSITPPPSECLMSSSPISTSVTLRQIWKVGSSIESVVRPGVTLTPDTVRDINRFIKWGISNTAELVQVKRDLRKTKYAERIQKTRWA
ncbi:hypothetical protein OnM2_083043 [Erysiphe neolycopersici]|uniref:DDE-1 domain-containing protein n=1 Tax=Erysiphe neolycopersici TaxID=212602 RepID=A0A420HFD3_9PEZI|nr:hypothetical protein OnM2_083043 [Erysiphe neolycopersici]